MKRWKQWMLRDVAPYAFLMKQKEKRRWPWLRLTATLLSSILAGIGTGLFQRSFFITLLFMLASAYGGYKWFWLYLYRSYVQKKEQMRDALIIWVNSLYALIGENNIYNAIVQSTSSAPDVLQEDLQRFLDTIALDHEDRDAYLGFLSQYQIDGFQDIMMKLFEYRELSKEKLRYEIAGLTKALAKIEQTQRERRFHRELFVADTLTMVMMSIPCMYMFFVSLLLSQLMME